MFSLFMSSFLSYLLVFLIFVAVIALAVTIGIVARVSINRKKEKAGENN